MKMHTFNLLISFQVEVEVVTKEKWNGSALTHLLLGVQFYLVYEMPKTQPFTHTEKNSSIK